MRQISCSVACNWKCARPSAGRAHRPLDGNGGNMALRPIAGRCPIGGRGNLPRRKSLKILACAVNLNGSMRRISVITSQGGGETAALRSRAERAPLQDTIACLFRRAYRKENRQWHFGLTPHPAGRRFPKAGFPRQDGSPILHGPSRPPAGRCGWMRHPAACHGSRIQPGLS